MKPTLPPEDEFTTLINRRKQQESLSALSFENHTSTSIRSRYAPPPQHQPEVFPLNEESYYAKPNYGTTTTTTTTTDKTKEFAEGMDRNAGLESRLEASLSRARARQEELTMQLRTQELSEREQELQVLKKINHNAFDLSDNIAAEPKSPVEKQHLREEKRKLYDVARNLDYSSRDAQSHGLFGASGATSPTTAAATPTSPSPQSNNMPSTSSRIGRRQQPTVDDVFS